MQEARRKLESAGLCEVVWVEDPANHPSRDAVVQHILERRQHKGVTKDEAAKLAQDPLYFGASLVALGEADGSVAGAVSTTADVIRAGIHCVGMADGISVVSSMFLMVRGDTAYSYADCGVVPDPDAGQLADIATITARNHELLTEADPRVAFLSFSTKGSAEHGRIHKVRAGLQIFQAKNPKVPSDGELQFDAAVVAEIAGQKAPGSPVAGNANVFIFPDLDAGNIAYKITQRLGGFDAYGPLIQGLRKPCLDLSRGCTAVDIVNVAAIASVIAG
jgi:phosphate acetyltransferase